MSAYGLAYDPATERIFARGSERQLKQLLQIDGARRAEDPGAPEGCVSVPASRWTFMACEAIATPVRVSPDYGTARGRAMAGDRAPFGDAAPWERVSLKRRLLPHQEEFCEIAFPRRGMINASEQGTGKTATGWVMAALWQAQRTLVVCPKSLVGSWMEEHGNLFQQIAGVFAQSGVIEPIPLDRGSIRVRATMLASLQETDLPVAAILNYEVLAALEPAIREWAPDLLILDESWRIKNPRASVTAAAQFIADRCAHVLCLTGTPVGNHCGDLWSQIRVLGEEAMPLDYWPFMHRFALLVLTDAGPRQVWKPVGLADPVGLMQRLDPVWYRATKATCLQLPPKRHRTVTLPMDVEIETLYHRAEEEGEAGLGAPLSLSGARTILIRLQQLAGGHIPTPLDAYGSEWELRPYAHCPKLAWVREFAQDELLGNPEMRAIIWCRFNVEVARIGTALAAILGENRVAQITGETENDALETIKSSFNARDPEGVQVLVAQIAKLAYGHNLQAGDTHIRFSHTWSYVELSQAEDRSHRHGRTHAVDYVDLVLAGSVDEELLAALARKEDFATRLAPDTVGAKGGEEA